MNDSSEYEVDPRVPVDWENNTTLSYDGFYETLGMRPRNSKHVASRIADVLLAMIEANAETTGAATLFTMTRVPGIRLADFLARLATYSPCSPEVFILATIYIDRFHLARPDTCLTQMNSHK